MAEEAPKIVPPALVKKGSEVSIELAREASRQDAKNKSLLLEYKSLNSVGRKTYVALKRWWRS